MAWQTPKTDWAVKYDAAGEYTGNYFGAEDYNRIRDNLIYLDELAQQLWPAFFMPAPPQMTAESMVYAATVNALETALDALVRNTFDPGAAPCKTWAGNASAPTAEDWNRWEKSCALLYGALEQQAACRPTLALTLGGIQF